MKKRSRHAGFSLGLGSNNDGTLGTTAEHSIDKAAANTTPGKCIAAEDYDLPGQGKIIHGVPAFAQGYGLNPTDTNQLTSAEFSSAGYSMGFVPLVIHLPSGLDLDDATLSLGYPASNPGSVTYTGSGTTADPFTYSLPADSDSSQVDGIRLWTNDGGVYRTSETFEDDASPGEATLGYYVPPSPTGGYTVGDLEKLGFTEDDSGTVANNNVTLWVEAVKPSTELGDQIITAALVEGDAAPLAYSVHLTAAGGDLLIDANNSTQPGGATTPTPTPTPSSSNPELPTDSATLEAIKSQSPGKVIVVNTGDKNGNGVPDFADGYGLPLSGITGVTESLPDDTSNPSEHFVPLVLTLPPNDDPATTQVTLSYNGSNPGAVALSADSSGNLVFTPAPGAIRVWTKVGSYQDSQEDSPRTLADYVVPGATYTLAELGYTSEQASDNAPLVLYVEAVRAWSGTITASINLSELATITDAVQVTAINAQAIGSTAYSGAVDLADGSVTLPPTTDISTSGYGQAWGVSRTWTNEPVFNLGGQVGNGWSMLPYLIQGDSTVIEAGTGQGAEYFDDTWNSSGDPIFKARFGVLDQLTYNSTSDTYALLDTSGDVITFNGFGVWSSGGSLLNNAPEGAFLSYADPNGNVTTASYSAVDTGSAEAGGPKQYQLSTITHGSDTFSYAWNGPTGGGAVKTLGMLEDVTLSGTAGPIESESFGYYSSGDDNGESNDLRNVTVEDSSGATIGSDYYLYSDSGGADELAYVFGSSAVALLAGHGFSLPLASTDSTDVGAMAPFADSAFTYGGAGMAATQTIQGAGSSSKSSPSAEGTYGYAFTTEGNGPVGVNYAQTQAVVSPPGAPDQTIAMNFAGETLSSSMTDSGDPNGALDGKTWTTTYLYNPNAQITTVTQPSLLQNVTEYWGPSDSGEPAGYVKDTKLVSPSGVATGGGTITALQSYITYGSHASGGYTIYPVATSAVYAATASSLTDSSAETTSFSYSWHSLAPSEITTTLPVVYDQGNTTGTVDTTTQSFNTLGWLTDSVDAAGDDTSYSYDLATGFQIGMTQQLGDDESPISTSATDDIYGRPHFEVDADGNTSTVSYSDGLLDSTVTTTPPTGAVTVENDNAEAGTVTTEDLTSLGGTTLSETVETDNYAGEEVAEKDYTSADDFEETDEAYNAQGEESQTTEPDGTIDDEVFDNLGREFKELTANSSGASTTDSEQFYDNDGVGDSDPTEQIENPGADQEITNESNNWEDEPVATESGLGAGGDSAEQKPLIDYQTLDNLGDTLTDQTFDGAGVSIGSPVNGVPAAPAGSALRAETEYTPDALGGDSQTQTLDINQSDGSTVATDTTANTYDANLDPVSSSDTATGTVNSDSTQPVTTNTTDDAGRVTKQKTMVGTTFVSEIDTQYDPDGNAIFITNTVSQPGGGNRVTYTGNWYNDDDQLVTSVNYGTNGGTAMTSRPDTAPSRSTTPGAPEVTSYTYTPEGYVDETTDPRGLVTKNYYDELGNVTKTVNNYDADVDGGTTDAEYPDVNQTTDLTYNNDNQVVDQTAEDPGGVNQTTENVYGPSGADNDKSLLLAVEYPDPTTGDASSSNEVTYTYNSNGTVATMTDRDGTVHAYQYDDDGNQIADVVTKLGKGVDGTVMQRDTDYNDLGQPIDYTAKNADGVVLQVEETYDGDGDITSEAQSHDGAVDDDTPSVDYGYQDTAGGQDQQTSITYPDRRKIALSYGTSGSLTDAEGWVYSIADANSLGEDTLATYSYMGDGTMVGQSRPQTGANEAITLDNFGNIADLNWTNSAAASTDHYGYGYDADGNVMYKENYVDTADSELYHANGASGGYDGLNRLTTFARGTLSTSTGGVMLDTISSPSTTQSWDLDAVGNQQSVTTNGTTQTKTQNGQNQTTSVATGGTTNNLTYDANGATTTDEQGRKWTYDAWGDPVSVANSSGTVIETDAFDALGRRITFTTYSGGSPTTTEVYYSTAGQLLEEDKSGSVVSQTVYGPNYVNSIIEVDQATGSPGTLDQHNYVQQDANYNVTSITDTSGTVLERYTYSPYGTQIVLNPDGSVKGDGTPASSSYNLPNGFQGMLFDPVLSDNLTPARVYDPMLGTWTSEDPAGASGSGNNLYQMTGSDPTSLVDPTGLRGDELDMLGRRVDGSMRDQPVQGAAEQEQRSKAAADEIHAGILQAQWEEAAAQAEQQRHQRVWAGMTIGPAEDPPPVVWQWFNAARQAVFNTVANGSPVLILTNATGLTDTSHIYRAPNVAFEDFDRQTQTGEKVILVASLAVPVVAPEAAVTTGATAATDAEVAESFTLSLRESGKTFDFPGCFAAGTLVLTSRGKVPIEGVQIGSRVITARAGQEQPEVAAPSAAGYRAVRLEYDDARSGHLMEIRLLRPKSLVEALAAGDTVRLSILELGVDDRARVVAVEPCPPIEPGPGRVVTGTFRSLSPDVRRLNLEGLDDPVEVTGSHPIYSEDRQKFVAVQSLEAGEALRTRSGTAGVRSVGRRAGSCPVFNLEIGEVHQYFVSELEVLAHNGSAGVNAAENAVSKLPEFDGTTKGFLVPTKPPGPPVPLESGSVTGARFPFSQADGHLETNAANWMRENGVTEATAYHNNPNGTCGNCDYYLPWFLEENSILRVVPPEDAVAPTSRWMDFPTTYKGNSGSPY